MKPVLALGIFLRAEGFPCPVQDHQGQALLGEGTMSQANRG